jgi:ribosome biogenesis GTPase A
MKRKEVLSMIINWFPGHMAKARKLIETNLKIIDVVIELVDARIPMSSTNPMIDKLVGQKPSIIVLNKADLADPGVLQDWVQYYKSQGRHVLALNSKDNKGVKQLISIVRSLAAPKLERWKARGLKTRSVRTMILGIPNVGKSTLINKLSRRNAAKTADKPGETKGKQWVHLGGQLDLLDTPGVLWPKLENQVSAYRLAATGAISDTAFDMETVLIQLIDELEKHYPDELKARFKLDEWSDTPLEVIETIGRKRGCLVAGNQVDFEKTYKMILKDYREGKIGAISLDRVDEFTESRRK